jgi:hypothetical protein
MPPAHPTAQVHSFRTRRLDSGWRDEVIPRGAERFGHAISWVIRPRPRIAEPYRQVPSKITSPGDRCWKDS